MSLPKSRLLLLAVLAAVVFAVSVGLTVVVRRERARTRAASAQALNALSLDVPAPDVSFLPRSGRAVPLASYRGRLVFVNFWATWCGPCVREMPSLLALRGRLDPSDVAFVSVAEDDTWEPLEEYLRATPLPFDVYRDQPPRVEDHFEVRSYPTSFVIDRDGRALYRFDGGRDWDDGSALALFESLGAARR